MFELVWIAKRGRIHSKFYADSFKVFVDARKHKKFQVNKHIITADNEYIITVAQKGF